MNNPSINFLPDTMTPESCPKLGLIYFPIHYGRNTTSIVDIHEVSGNNNFTNDLQISEYLSWFLLEGARRKSS